MNNQIKQLLIDKNLTPSHFADEIGVQRATIFHIINNRNKPSLEIIQKILRRYPELTFDYFMNNEDNEAKNEVKTPVNQAKYGTETSYDKASDLNRKKSANDGRVSSESQTIKNNQKMEAPFTDHPFIQTGDRKIAKIVILYTDNTFTEYFPQ